MARDDAATVKSADPTAGSGWAGAVPSLQARTVVAVFRDTEALNRAYRELRESGFGDQDVSIVRQGETAPPMGADETRAGTGIAAGAGVGAVLGGIAGLAALAIPGFGPLIAAGPIAAALGGAATGGAIGALAGSFAGLGIPREHAEEYEAAVRAGGTFLSVKTPDVGAAERVAALLRRDGADQISTYQPAL